MTSERQKLLVAVDGSEQSLEVVRYVAGICAPKRVEVTLFHVLSPVSESFWDLRTAHESSVGFMDFHRAAEVIKIGKQCVKKNECALTFCYDKK